MSPTVLQFVAAADSIFCRANRLLVSVVKLVEQNVKSNGTDGPASRTGGQFLIAVHLISVLVTLLGAHLGVVVGEREKAYRAF